MLLHQLQEVECEYNTKYLSSLMNRGCIDCLLGAIIFATLDFMSGYWQPQVRQDPSGT